MKGSTDTRKVGQDGPPDDPVELASLIGIHFDLAAQYRQEERL